MIRIAGYNNSRRNSMLRNKTELIFWPHLQSLVAINDLNHFLASQKRDRVAESSFAFNLGPIHRKRIVVQ